MKRTLGLVGRVVVGVAVMAALLRFVGHQPLLATMQRANLPWLLVAVGAYLATVALRGVRWRNLLLAQRIAAPLPLLVYLDLVGSFFNLVLPSSVGGDVVKFYELTRDHAAPGDDVELRAASSLVADRLCGLVVLIFLGGAMVPFAAAQLPRGLAMGVFWLAVGSASAVALLGNGRLRAWVRARGARVPWLARRATLWKLYDTLDGYRGRPLAGAVVAAVAFNLLMIGVNVALGRAFGAALALPLYFVFVPLISLVQALPLSVNGIGLREGGYVVLLGQAALAPEVALAMGLGYYGCMVVAGVLGGLLYLGRSVQGLQRATVGGRSQAVATLRGPGVGAE